MAKLIFPDEAALLAALQGNEAERRRGLQHFFENPRLLAWVVRQVQMQGAFCRRAICHRPSGF